MREKETRITFLLPGRGTKPVGGFKVVYEYANHLSERGYLVKIVHIAWLYKYNSFIEGIGRYLYILCFYKLHKNWFVLNSKVISKWIFSPFSFLIPDADFIVATSWEIADHVNILHKTKGKKLYLIQCDESEFTYVIEKNLQQNARATWQLPMHKISICTWLSKKIVEKGQQSTLIFNGLNFADFFIEKHFTQRNPKTVMALYHSSPHKGSKDALAGFDILKKEFHDLQVILFGVLKRPENLPEWIQYYQKPQINNLRKLYNETSIFISPSYSEGWGLPVAEAMQCGCATVTTNIGGFKDFVEDGFTSLCFTPGDVGGMVNAIRHIFENPGVALQLANNGNNKIQQFTWQKSTDKFVEMLNSLN